MSKSISDIPDDSMADARFNVANTSLNIKGQFNTAINNAQTAADNATNQIDKTLGLISNSASNVGDRLNNITAAGSPTLQPGGNNQSVSTNPSVSGKNPDTALSELHSLEGWNENALNDVQQATYHIRLFMIEEQPFNPASFPSYQSLREHLSSGVRQTTIAESGVTGINIASMQIRNQHGPTVSKRSMTATKITMSIVEPGGVSFMDLLAEASRELKVHNYAKSQFFIEVRFMGYKGSSTSGVIGDFDENPCRDFPNGGVWLYQTLLNTIDTDVTSQGSNMTLEFVMFSEQIQFENDLCLPSIITPEGSSAAAMIQDLLSKFNDYVKFMYGYQLRSYNVKFQKFMFENQFYDPSDPTTFKLIPSDPGLNSKNNVVMAQTQGVFKATFPHGTKISDAIELIFANCEIVQQLAKNVMIKDELTIPANKIRQAVLLRFHSTAVASSYDFATAHYVIDYTITMKPYTTQKPIITSDQIAATRNVDVQRENVIKLRKNGYLSKRYDYLFTGLNTEVVSFDIKHQVVWSALLPRVMGAINSVEANADFDFKNQILKKQNMLREIQAAAKVQLDEVKKVDSEIKKIVDSKDTSASSRKQLSELQAKKDVFNEGTRLDARNRDALTADILIAREKLQNQEMSAHGVISNTRDKIRYAEEILSDPNSDPSDKYDPMPLSIRQSNQDSRFYANGAMPDYYHKDRAVFGGVMDQLYETTGSALQKITLEIKGDPYWLGRANLEEIWYNASSLEKTIDLSSPVDGDTVRPDYTKGDVLFLLTYKYPRGITENGSPDIRFNDYFTGIYHAQEVMHRFDGGTLSQSISATRVPTLEAFRAFGLRSESEYTQIAQTQQTNAEQIARENFRKSERNR